MGDKELIAAARKVAYKGVAMDDGYTYSVPARDLVRYRETILKLVHALESAETTTDVEWGVFHQGRNLGWVAYTDRTEAEWEMSICDDKYLPAFLAYRTLGPVEVVS